MAGVLKVWNGTAWVYVTAGTGSPVGAVVSFAGDTPPVGWLLCNGTTFSSTAYPLLAGVLGDKYGLHVGSSYYVPDLRKRIPVGLDATDTTFDTLGKTGGAKTVSTSHQHYIDHTHVVPGHQHPLSISSNASLGGSSIRNNASFTQANAQFNTGTSNERPYSDFGGPDVSVLQPFVTLNYIICAK